MAKTDQLKKLPFEGKVAVLAGATDGIGYAIADRLAHDGAKVMVSSRKQVNVDKAVESLQKQHGTESVSGVICHVGKDEDRKRLIKESIKQFGRIDILVDNAGVNPSYKKTLKTTEEQWAKIFEINVSAAALLVQEAYPYLKKNGGSVVFVSSNAAYMGGSSYAVSKTALVALTRSLASELARDNIRVNGIAPGLIKTRFGEAIWGDEATLKKGIEKMWIKRIGQPEDCCGAVAFLCSDDASYITGDTIVIAGMTARL